MLPCKLKPIGQPDKPEAIVGSIQALTASWIPSNLDYTKTLFSFYAKTSDKDGHKDLIYILYHSDLEDTAAKSVL